jgi:hypothetical protein
MRTLVAVIRPAVAAATRGFESLPNRFLLFFNAKKRKAIDGEPANSAARCDARE